MQAFLLVAPTSPAAWGCSHARGHKFVNLQKAESDTSENLNNRNPPAGLGWKLRAALLNKERCVLNHSYSTWRQLEELLLQITFHKLR